MNWIIPEYAGVRVGDIQSFNDGDVALSVATAEVLSTTTFPVCYDIGADKGWWSAFCLAHQRSRVVAFEPNLLRSMDLAKREFFTPRFTLVPKAVSNCDGTLRFTNLEGLSHSREESNERVACVSLKSFLVAEKQVDMMKIDVEGHEPIILEDIYDDLDRVKNLCFEFTAWWFESKEKAIELLRKISDKYCFLYHLSRRGPPRLSKIENIEEFVSICSTYHYQTDIFASNKPLLTALCPI